MLYSPLPGYNYPLTNEHFKLYLKNDIHSAISAVSKEVADYFSLCLDEAESTAKIKATKNNYFKHSPESLGFSCCRLLSTLVGSLEGKSIAQTGHYAAALTFGIIDKVTIQLICMEADYRLH